VSDKAVTEDRAGHPVGPLAFLQTAVLAEALAAVEAADISRIFTVIHIVQLAATVAAAQSVSSGAQDALSHQPIQETYNERNSD
jgi:hypothetical protein